MLELFSFVRAGGELDRIVVKPLDAESVGSTISALDISKADCYLRQDKQRILAIVESSYGSSRQFNRACQKILSMATGAKEGGLLGGAATSKSGGKYKVRAVAPE